MAIAGLVLAGDLTMVAVFARSDLPLTPLAVIAVTAGLVRLASSVMVVRHATGARRTLVADDIAEDADGRA
jgi:hypothetical protein